MNRDFPLGNGRVLTQTAEQCRTLVEQAFEVAELVTEMSLLQKLAFVRKSIERAPCVIGVYSVDGPARKDGSFDFHIIKGRQAMQADADNGGRDGVRQLLSLVSIWKMPKQWSARLATVDNRR